MRISRLLIICISIVVMSSLLSACSDVQNREKKSSSETSNKSSISIKIISRSTTSGTETTPKLDSKIEKIVTESLTRLLIRGTNSKNVIPESMQEKAKTAFPDNKNSIKNSADVSLSYMSTGSDQDLIVAEVSQKITSKSNEIIVRSGKIYFDKDGKVVGFDFNEAQSAVTTTTKEQA